MATRAGYYPLAVVAEVMKIGLDEAYDEMLLAGVKVHDAGATMSISRSGLARYARVNYPQGGRAREAFIERVNKAMR